MTNPVTASALVGIGGFCGSIARYGLSLFCQRWSVEWPFGTLAANILGCFVIGIVSSLSERTESISPLARLLLATGFCGGFTTMSSMIYETAQMLRSGEYLHVSSYLAISFAGSMAAFLAGSILVRLLARSVGGPWS